MSTWKRVSVGETGETCVDHNQNVAIGINNYNALPA